MARAGTTSSTSAPARAISAAGGTRDDVVHIAYGYGLFTGGFGLHYGAERVGATVIPASSGNTIAVGATRLIQQASCPAPEMMSR